MRGGDGSFPHKKNSANIYVYLLEGIKVINRQSRGLKTVKNFKVFQQISLFVLADLHGILAGSEAGDNASFQKRSPEWTLLKPPPYRFRVVSL